MQLILFDCDGTLVDSQALIQAAMTGAFRTLGLAPPERSQTLSVVGLSLPEAMARMLPAAGPATHLRAAEAYKTAAIALRDDAAYAEPFFAGARETVLALAAQPGILLGLATGKSRRGVDRLIAHAGLDGVFAAIETADSAPSKPHPGMILQAMRTVGAQAARTTMIGDTTFDLDMARSAGVRGIGVAWGYHPVVALRASGANHVVHSFAELHSVLGLGFRPA
jgi:phosphoglycolate phosphatase